MASQSDESAGSLIVECQTESFVKLGNGRPFNMTYTDQGELVVMKLENRMISVDIHSVSGELMQEIAPTNSGFWDVTCCKELIYISDGNHGLVYVYNRHEGFLVRSINTTIKQMPSIAICNNYLLIASCTHSTIFKIDLNDSDDALEVFAGKKADKNSPLSSPRYIASDFDSVVVSCSKPNKVLVLNTDGSTRFVYKGEVSLGEIGNLNHPKGVCVNKKGQIMIADSFNNRIVLLQPDGNLIGYILVREPDRIAAAPDNKLCVRSAQCSELKMIAYD